MTIKTKIPRRKICLAHCLHCANFCQNKCLYCNIPTACSNRCAECMKYCHDCGECDRLNALKNLTPEERVEDALEKVLGVSPALVLAGFHFRRSETTDALAKLEEAIPELESALQLLCVARAPSHSPITPSLEGEQVEQDELTG